MFKLTVIYKRIPPRLRWCRGIQSNKAPEAPALSIHVNILFALGTDPRFHWSGVVSAFLNAREDLVVESGEVVKLLRGEEMEC